MIFSIGCHSNHVPYKHLSLDDNEILVDKIVSLQTDKKKDPNVVKIVTTDFGIDKTRHPHHQHNDLDHNIDNNLMDIIKELKNEIKEMKSSQLKDR